MVASASGHDGSGTTGFKTKSQYGRTAKQKRRITSTSSEIKSRYLSLVRRKYRSKGYSNTAIDLIFKSWRKSTLNQYIVYAKLWFTFSAQGLKPSLRNIIEFLSHLHVRGFSHDQICAARSAVGVISNVDNIGKHPDVSPPWHSLTNIQTPALNS